MSSVDDELRLTNARLQASVDELKETQRALVDASRRAGMADVATSVLHNVGNVLNSVNVSANVLAGLAKASKGVGLTKAVALLREQPDPGKFLSEDPRGRKLIDYLSGVANALETDRAKAIEEAASLEKNVDHIKAIITLQQSQARGGGVAERIALRASAHDMLQMATGALAKHDVAASYDFGELGGIDSMLVDRHKLFQIAMNLLMNAAQALKPRSSGRQIWMSLAYLPDDDRVAFIVKDNGVGIPAENLTKIFGHGFTTKADGHGFGLHSCANAAAEMGGKLEAASEGPDLGATFTLTLPRDATSPVSRRGAVSASP